jgi:hypothetical protein
MSVLTCRSVYLGMHRPRDDHVRQSRLRVGLGEVQQLRQPRKPHAAVVLAQHQDVVLGDAQPVTRAHEHTDMLMRRHTDAQLRIDTSTNSLTLTHHRSALFATSWF